MSMKKYALGLNVLAMVVALALALPTAMLAQSDATLTDLAPSAGTLTLSGTNTYTDGTVINAGTLRVFSDASLGDASNGITVTANSNFQALQGTTITFTFNRAITLQNNAVVRILDQGVRGWAINSTTITGPVTGEGGVTLAAPSAPDIRHVVKLTNTGNNFTGPVRIGEGSSSSSSTLEINSLADSATATAPITFGESYNNGEIFRWGDGAASPLILNNRPIVVGGGPSVTIENANATPANSITINTALTLASHAIRTAATLNLAGLNTGANRITSNLADRTEAVARTLALVYVRWPEERKGVPPGYIRVSVGLEDADDIIADIHQALDKAG
jgi:autotransporter-associated beta strand protein